MLRTRRNSSPTLGVEKRVAYAPRGEACFARRDFGFSTRLHRPLCERLSGIGAGLCSFSRETWNVKRVGRRPASEAPPTFRTWTVSEPGRPALAQFSSLCLCALVVRSHYNDPLCWLGLERSDKEKNFLLCVSAVKIFSASSWLGYSKATVTVIPSLSPSLSRRATGDKISTTSSG